MEDHVYPHMYRIENEHWWFAARQHILMKYLDSHVSTSPHTRLLDVGCGTGAILELFSRRFEAHGVDVSRQAVEFCRKRGLKNVFVGSLELYPKEQPFDIVTMLDVLEHVEDHRGLLQNAHALLRHGGHLLITVPSFPSLWSHHDVMLHHQRRYTKSKLRFVVESAGFNIEHITFFNTLLFPLAVAKRWLAKITGARTTNDLEIPHRFVNRILRGVFELEAAFVPQVSLPVGLSLLCLARKSVR